MRKFESLQKDESRAQSAHFSKAYRNLELLFAIVQELHLLCELWAEVRSSSHLDCFTNP